MNRAPELPGQVDPGARGPSEIGPERTGPASHELGIEGSGAPPERGQTVAPPTPSDAPTVQASPIAVSSAEPAPAPLPAPGRPPGYDGACTAPQLRRFIKSRAYVPMHELRRRFGINGADDDVTPVALGDGRVYVGLPMREGALLGELLRGGEVGFELSMDPVTPIIVGVYPMRPVPRP